MNDGRAPGPDDPTVTTHVPGQPAASLVLQQLSGYKLQFQIARGGMGVFTGPGKISLNRPSRSR